VPNQPKAGPEVVAVEIHNTPVWKPPVIATNPYTGEVTDSKPGSWMQNGTVEITIRNHPFSPYTDENGNTINTYYCIFYKYADFDYMGSGVRGVPLAMYQSDSDYTIIVFKYGEPTATINALGTFLYYAGDVSFRIQTVEDGYFGRDSYSGDRFFEGVGSKWTEFTITIPPHDPYKDKNPSGIYTPNIKPTTVAPSISGPSNPLLQNPNTIMFMLLVIVCIIMIPLVVLAYHYGQRKSRFLSDDSVKKLFVR
jgi:hypothetical protein